MLLHEHNAELLSANMPPKIVSDELYHTQFPNLNIRMVDKKGRHSRYFQTLQLKKSRDFIAHNFGL